MAGAGEISGVKAALRLLFPFAREAGQVLGRGGKGISTAASRLPRARAAAVAASAAAKKSARPAAKKAVSTSGRGVRTAKTTAAARTTAKKAVATAGKRADAGARTAGRASATASAAAKKSVASSGTRADAAGRASSKAAREAAAKAVAQKQVIARGAYDSGRQVKWAKRYLGVGAVLGGSNAYGQSVNNRRATLPSKPSSVMGGSSIMGGSARSIPRRPSSVVSGSSIMGGGRNPSRPSQIVGSSAIMGGRSVMTPKPNDSIKQTSFSRPSQQSSLRTSTNTPKSVMPKMAKGRTVSQSNTEWVAKGTTVNGQVVPKGYLAQKGKPNKRVTANVRIETPSQGQWTPAGGGQMVGGTKKGEVYAYKSGRRTGAMKKK